MFRGENRHGDEFQEQKDHNDWNLTCKEDKVQSECKLEVRLWRTLEAN